MCFTDSGKFNLLKVSTDFRFETIFTTALAAKIIDLASIVVKSDSKNSK